MEHLKIWITHRKAYFIFMMIGGVGGFLYWKYVGCATGTCAITSVWWRSTIYGAILGWLLGGIVNDKFFKKEDEH